MKVGRAFQVIGISLALMAFPLFLHASDEKIADVVEVVSKAIVNISTAEYPEASREAKGSDFFRRFFPQEAEEDTEASSSIGSGVVLDPSGLIVTNEHVISKAIRIHVKFTNREEYEANVIAADPEFDIALLKVDAKKEFPFLKVKKGNVRVGERAIAIGNPFGLSSSVTVGVISALGRPPVEIGNRVYANLIQTDAAINPGNSGGALLDAKGNLIGIVTAVYEEGKGIGFAIPIEDVMAMLSEFNEQAGKRAIFGIFVDKKKDDEDQYLNISRIIPGSPAEAYGLKVGDRIVEIDGKKVREGMKLQNMFRKASPSDTNQIKIVRGDDTINVNIERKTGYVPTPLDESLCGIRLADIHGYVKLKFKLKQKTGVVVTKVTRNGIGDRYGLKAGDVIIKINNGEVTDKTAFQSLMVEGLRRNYVLFQVKRNETVFFAPIKLDTLL